MQRKLKLYLLLLLSCFFNETLVFLLCSSGNLAFLFLLLPPFKCISWLVMAFSFLFGASHLQEGPSPLPSQGETTRAKTILELYNSRTLLTDCNGTFPGSPRPARRCTGPGCAPPWPSAPPARRSSPGRWQRRTTGATNPPPPLSPPPSARCRGGGWGSWGGRARGWRGTRTRTASSWTSTCRTGRTEVQLNSTSTRRLRRRKRIRWQ